MAERRMFAKSVVESDSFMDMPAEAQALYFHLCMAADDDGFCDNPRTVMRGCAASNDTMKLLISKKFVLTFEKNDGFIVVVKHWRLNNYIRKDTYHETKYKEFMRELYFDENQSYSMNPGDGHVPCLTQNLPAHVTPASQARDEPVTDPSRTRDESLTQDSIGKVSIGKVNNVVVDARVREGDPANDLGRVMDIYFDKINPTPSPTCIGYLKSYTERLGADVVIHAIEIALDDRKLTWSYIQAILQRYSKQGLDSLDKVLDDERQREEQKQEPPAKGWRAGRNAPITIKQGDVSGEFAEINRLLESGGF